MFWFFYSVKNKDLGAHFLLKYRISANSFRGNYSFLKFSYSFRIMAIFYFINWIVAMETVEGGKQFKGGNYSRKYGKFLVTSIFKPLYLQKPCAITGPQSYKTIRGQLQSGRMANFVTKRMGRRRCRFWLSWLVKCRHACLTVVLIVTKGHPSVCQWKAHRSHGPWLWQSQRPVWKALVPLHHLGWTVDWNRRLVWSNRPDFLGDHRYITSAKGLGGWGQKNGKFCWGSVLFMLT